MICCTPCTVRGHLTDHRHCPVVLHQNRGGASSHEGELSANEDEGQQLHLPSQPGSSQPRTKRRRVRPPTHGERMENLHAQLLTEIKSYSE